VRIEEVFFAKSNSSFRHPCRSLFRCCNKGKREGGEKKLGEGSEERDKRFVTALDLFQNQKIENTVSARSLESRTLCFRRDAPRLEDAQEVFVIDQKGSSGGKRSEGGGLAGWLPLNKKDTLEEFIPEIEGKEHLWGT